MLKICFNIRLYLVMLENNPHGYCELHIWKELDIITQKKS
jgi:hypothetical protein